MVLLQSASLLADSEAQPRLPIRAFEKVCYNISSKIMLGDWDADEFCVRVCSRKLLEYRSCRKLCPRGLDTSLPLSAKMWMSQTNKGWPCYLSWLSFIIIFAIRFFFYHTTSHNYLLLWGFSFSVFTNRLYILLGPVSCILNL